MVGKIIETSKVYVDKKDLLGEGGFASVYKGKYKVTDETVAVKKVDKVGNYAREIQILEKVKEINHRNLVCLLDHETYLEDGEYLLIIMEHCPLKNLSDYIEYNKPLSDAVLQNFLRQLAEGYSVLRKANIVHRDLKPQNILLCPTENIREFPDPPPYPAHTNIIIKIADFGISRFLNKDGKATTDIGTDLYQAPEVARKNYRYKVDLWSIGIIIVECLLGFKELKKYDEVLVDFGVFRPKICKLVKKNNPLRSLLQGLLMRNFNKRMDFEKFINHTFLNPPGLPNLSTLMVPPKSEERSENQTPNNENGLQSNNEQVLVANTEVEIPQGNSAGPSEIAAPALVQGFHTRLLPGFQQMGFATNHEMETVSDKESSR